MLQKKGKCCRIFIFRDLPPLSPLALGGPSNNTFSPLFPPSKFAKSTLVPKGALSVDLANLEGGKRGEKIFWRIKLCCAAPLVFPPQKIGPLCVCVRVPCVPCLSSVLASRGAFAKTHRFLGRWRCARRNAPLRGIDFCFKKREMLSIFYFSGPPPPLPFGIGRPL